MYKSKTLLFLALWVSFAFAFTFPLTTNVDAEVTFSGGGTPVVVNTVGGVVQNVTVPWIDMQMAVQVVAVSKHPWFANFNESMTLSQHVVNFPAWNPSTGYAIGSSVFHNGQNWRNPTHWANAGVAPGPAGGPNWEIPWVVIPASELPLSTIEINLPVGALSTDSVFIPIYSEVDAELEITCANGFTGRFNIARRTTDTLALPLVFEGNFDVSAGQGVTRRAMASARLVSRQGRHQLFLPSSEFTNSEIRIVATNGRVISRERLTEINRANISVSSIAAGVYFLNVRSANGANFTQRFFHSGGDLRLTTSFSGHTSAGDNNPTTIMRADVQARSAEPSYKFRFIYRGVNHDSDTSMQITARSGEIRNQHVYVSLLGAQFSDLLTREQYNKIFANRFGLGRTACANSDMNDANADCSRGRPAQPPSDGDFDFFTYESLLRAIEIIGEKKIRLTWVRDNAGMIMGGYQRVLWTNKRTGETRTFTMPGDFDAWANQVEVGYIDFADFTNAGNLSLRKRELAAFFGNIAQETGGMATGADIHYHWGLYWREEVPWQHGGTHLGYVDGAHAIYPPSPGRSYHGRGPLQLSWNYNYGQFSEFLFGDKQHLLDNPHWLTPRQNETPGMPGNSNVPGDAIYSWASAVWFWMMPQAPKVSCHMVFREDFVPSAEDNARGRDLGRRFGWSVSIINGGLECNRAGTAQDYRVRNRIDHYQAYLQILGEPRDESAELGCDNMNY